MCSHSRLDVVANPVTESVSGNAAVSVFSKSQEASVELLSLVGDATMQVLRSLPSLTLLSFTVLTALPYTALTHCAHCLLCRFKRVALQVQLPLPCCLKGIWAPT